jgi:hypothetical protein
VRAVHSLYNDYSTCVSAASAPREAAAASSPAVPPTSFSSGTTVVTSAANGTAPSAAVTSIAFAPVASCSISSRRVSAARARRLSSLVGGIQRIYDGGWDPSAESDGSKSEQVKQCMDLAHFIHWLHLKAVNSPGEQRRKCLEVVR